MNATARRSDAPDASGDGESERMCAVSRERLPADKLLRFVAAPDGTVTPDLRRKLPGRGVSVGISAGLVREAVKRKVFRHALKREVIVPADLEMLVDRLLETDALNMLSMVNKAGLAVAGYEKAREALAKGRALARLEACDGAADGRGKLDRYAAALAGESAPPPVIALFSAAQLGLALGRENAIHAIACAGPASASFVARCATLAEYRSGNSHRGAAAAGKNEGGQGSPKLQDVS